MSVRQYCEEFPSTKGCSQKFEDSELGLGCEAGKECGEQCKIGRNNFGRCVDRQCLTKADYRFDPRSGSEDGAGNPDPLECEGRVGKNLKGSTGENYKSDFLYLFHCPLTLSIPILSNCLSIQVLEHKTREKLVETALTPGPTLIAGNV